MADNVALSPAKVEKAREAIEFLSSLPLPARSAGGDQQPGPSRASVPRNDPRPRRDDEHRCHTEGILQKTDQALNALYRMKAGMKADKLVARKRVKKEMSNLFRTKKQRLEKRVVWRHKFVCLAYAGQERIPTTDADKEELFQAGLGEKEIAFEDLEMSQSDFRNLLLTHFPRLEEGGGFQLLKGLPNTRQLEVLSMAVQCSPALLKQRVGSSRTYIRPVQRDLDLTPTEDSVDAPLEKCLTCGCEYPLNELPDHIQECEKALKDIVGHKDTAEDHKGNRSCDSVRDAIDLTQDGPRLDDNTEDLFCVEDELVQRAIQQSIVDQDVPSSHLNDSGAKPSYEVSTIGDAIKALKSSVMVEDEPVILEIRRTHLLKDALKEARKKKFQPSKPVKFRFVGEGAIDYGGPRREFFRLLAAEASDRFFIGTSTQKFFASNVSAVQGRDLYNFGRYIGMSIIQGGSGLPCLANPVYDYLCTGKSTGVDIAKEDVPYKILSFVVNKVDAAENDDELKIVFAIDEAADLLHETGYQKPLCRLTMRDQPALRSALLDYHCMLKAKAAIDQFCEGLEELGVLQMVRKFPAVMRPLFVATVKVLRPEDLKGLVTVEYSVEGCSRRPAEHQAWVHFGDFLDECEEGANDCQVEDVLVFFTGADRVPPLGFEKEPKVTFLHDSHAQFCTASTYDLQLRLPTSHGEDYQSFREAMVMSLKSNDGFGGL